MDRILLVAVRIMLVVGLLAILYVVAPILIPFIVIVAGLGLLTWGIVTLSRLAERHFQNDD